MKTSLEQAFSLASPRSAPRATQLPAMLVHCGIIALWLVLFARAFFLDGVVAWSTGIAYIVYDTLLLAFVTVKSLPLLTPARKPERVRGRSKMPSLGVIVASHNEASVLPITLAGLLAQIDGPAQIVIADDGSTDGTAALLAERFGLVLPSGGELSAASSLHPNLYWLRVPHGGKARALNAAIVRMTTDIVMTVDADTRLAKDASLAMRSAFADNPKLVAAAGILVPMCAKTLSGRLLQWFQTYEYIRNFIARFAWMRVNSLLLVSGAFACFRRNALLMVGGFDPQCLTEDYELIHRLHRYAADNGIDWQVQVLGNAHALTDAPGTLGSFMRQRRRWFAGFLQTQYWNRDMIGNRRFGTLGLLMLPVKAFDTVQPIYGLTAFALLLAFIADRHGSIVVPIFSVIGAKIVIDFAFHLWSLHLYRRWTGDRATSSLWMAVATAVVEPFTFQLLRHVGATLGWIYFLSGARAWGAQDRTGIVASEEGQS
ncbi:glycosyltransferase family 2 protein [Paraburkholderia sp. CI3]|uniref:glycosyltransferase family 2 protein n=1 Tax=Paraburkholderia sp. CI3 TaxID=2991060 RepID=UPI003D21387C